jgi:ADP-ribose diphosphatase
MRERRTLEPWQVLRRRELLDASPWVRVWAEDVQLPSGAVIEGFKTLEMPDFAIVVPVLGDGGVVVLRAYKHGPRRVGIQLPGGYVEAGENLLTAAKRELLEETGYESDEWSYLGHFANDGNRGSGRAYYFLARDVSKVADPVDDESEEAVVATMPLDELVRAMHDGEVDVVSIAAAIGLAATLLR